MSVVVILAGGYHPLHRGHLSLHDNARKVWPQAEVFLAATDDTKERPFPFKVKSELAKINDIENFVQVKNPYRPKEITDEFDPNSDILIFVRSNKDKNEQPLPGGKNKDGSPSYFQPYDKNRLQPFGKHAYIAYLPTIEFGPGLTSASEIRDYWPKLNDSQKRELVREMYAWPQGGKKEDYAVKLINLVLDPEANENSEPALVSENSAESEKFGNEADPMVRKAMAYINQHYPDSPDTQSAFIKFVLRSLKHSEEADQEQEERLDSLEQEISQMKQDYLEEI